MKRLFRCCPPRPVTHVDMLRRQVISLSGGDGMPPCGSAAQSKSSAGGRARWPKRRWRTGQWPTFDAYRLRRGRQGKRRHLHAARLRASAGPPARQARVCRGKNYVVLMGRHVRAKLWRQSKYSSGIPAGHEAVQHRSAFTSACGTGASYALSRRIRQARSYRRPAMRASRHRFCAGGAMRLEQARAGCPTSRPSCVPVTNPKSRSFCRHAVQHQWPGAGRSQAAPTL